ncbi:MAG: DNA-protecting protein DprA [Actinobacteria bacterium]|nr:DNA-protecting protein DprA [Actinomycetota bacterium]
MEGSPTASAEEAPPPLGDAPGERPPPSWPRGFVRTGEDRRAALVLAHGRWSGLQRLMAVAERVGTASACLEAVASGEAGEAGQAGRRRVAGLRPEELEERLSALGTRFVARDGPEYPPSLDDLHDPPIGLFVRGGSLAVLVPRVAVVGARNCSVAGRELARGLGRGLGTAGVVLVSGGARGIDTAGHRGALDVGAPTIAVLGSGVDLPYPASNRRLLDQVAEAGAVVSEYPPGVRAAAFRFPARNRIVAALSLGVVVVEGTRRSGSMISADHALDLGRPVFALPGPVTSELAEGPLNLIRSGATMIRGTDDLLEDLGLHPAMGVTATGAPGGLGPVERAVLGSLAGLTLPEEVARALGVTPVEILPTLLRLELAGLVRSVGGRYERRLVGAG